MPTDEVEIVRSVVDGRVNDFRMLVDRYQDRVYRFVSNIVGRQHESEDVTQEVFLTAYRNLASYDSGRAAFSTWLFTIARNTALNHIRRRPQTLLSENEVDAADPRRARDTLEEDEFLERLDSALDALPLTHKTAFVLAEIEQLAYAEIASIEGVSMGTVKSRVHRAKRLLREALRAFARES